MTPRVSLNSLDFAAGFIFFPFHFPISQLHCFHVHVLNLRHREACPTVTAAFGKASRLQSPCRQCWNERPGASGPSTGYELGPGPVCDLMYYFRFRHLFQSQNPLVCVYMYFKKQKNQTFFIQFRSPIKSLSHSLTFPGLC